MEAIFPFKPLDRYRDIEDKETYFRIAALAVKAAGVHYKTRLVTDRAGAELFREKEIKFNTIEILDAIEKYKGNNPCMPKIFSMLSRKYSYIMLDFDSILLQKLPEDIGSCAGFLEVNLFKNSNFNPSYLNTDYITKHIDAFNYLNHTYISDYLTYLYGKSDILDNSIIWDKIPSMSLFTTDASDRVSECFNKLIEIFGFDVLDKITPQIFEQLIFFYFFKVTNYPISLLQDSAGVNIKDKANYYIHLTSDVNSKYRYILPYLEYITKSSSKFSII